MESILSGGQVGTEGMDSLGCAGSGVPYSSSRGLRAAGGGGDGGAAPVLPLDTACTGMLARNVVYTCWLTRHICLVIVSMFGSHTTSCWLGTCWCNVMLLRDGFYDERGLFPGSSLKGKKKALEQNASTDSIKLFSDSCTT